MDTKNQKPDFYTVFRRALVIHWVIAGIAAAGTAMVLVLYKTGISPERSIEDMTERIQWVTGLCTLAIVCIIHFGVWKAIATRYTEKMLHMSVVLSALLMSIFII